MSANPVALVTGSRRGIGRSIALTLAQQGYDIMVNDYQLDDLATATVADIQALGRAAHAIAADLGDMVQVQGLVDQTVDRFGRIDVLVNNAATWSMQSVMDVTEEAWDRVVDVDLKGPMFCAQAAARYMIQQGGGGIVSISSVHRQRCWADDVVYGICKAGIARMTESLALELGPHGIRVNAVAPGYIDSRVPSPDDTPIGQPAYAGPVIPVTPLRRIGLPEDIAKVVAFLVSDQASFMTGQTLTVDGGFLLGGTPKGG